MTVVQTCMILLSSLPLLGGFIVLAKYVLFALAAISFVSSALNLFEFDRYQYKPDKTLKASVYYQASCTAEVCGCVFLSAGLLAIAIAPRHSSTLPAQ